MRKLISIIAIAVVIGFFYYNKSFFIVEEFFTDQIRKENKEIEKEIVILGIDDESLEKIGQWPWPRSVIAETAEKLLSAGATAVWVDTLYTEPSQDPAQDKALQEVAQKYENFYLSSNFVFEQKQVRAGELAYRSYNNPFFPMDSDQIGHINVIVDRDKVVRRAILGVPKENGEMVPAISVRLANLMLMNTGKKITWNTKHEWFLGESKLPTGSRNDLYFAYATSPQENPNKVIKRKFDIFSIHKAISGKFPPEYFANSIVLIGPYAIGMGDQYYTPKSRITEMFGVEIHANIIQSLVEQTYYSKAPTTVGLSIITLMTLISFLIIDRLKARWGFVLFVCFIVLYIAALFAVYHIQQVLLPFFYVILLLIIVYITSVVSKYILELKERARVTNLFGRYVSRGVVDEILSSDEEVKLGGERKDVTLVFVDIRGFTPLSEKMEPEEVIVILNEYLDLCTKAVFEYDGTLDKFMGDGVMSIFGAPIEQEDHAERAIRAALRMKENAGEMEKRLEEKYGRSVSFGIGINSGPAVIGNIGSHDRLDYTAIGDTVNLSARLESNAKPGQILISENTYQLVKDKFEVTALDAIKVKGKEKPVTIYQVEKEL